MTTPRSNHALEPAREAYAQLEAEGSLEEGEAMVRLVYAEALSARGAREEFTAAIGEVLNGAENNAPA